MAFQEPTIVFEEPREPGGFNKALLMGVGPEAKPAWMKSFAVISANTELDLQGSGTNSSQLGRSEVNAIASSCPRSTTTWKVENGAYFCYVLMKGAQVTQKAPRFSLLEVLPMQCRGSPLSWLQMCCFRGCWGHTGLRFASDPSCSPPHCTRSLHFHSDIGKHQFPI